MASSPPPRVRHPAPATCSSSQLSTRRSCTEKRCSCAGQRTSSTHSCPTRCRSGTTSSLQEVARPQHHRRPHQHRVNTTAVHRLDRLQAWAHQPHRADPPAPPPAAAPRSPPAPSRTSASSSLVPRPRDLPDRMPASVTRFRSRSRRMSLIVEPYTPFVRFGSTTPYRRSHARSTCVLSPVFRETAPIGEERRTYPVFPPLPKPACEGSVSSGDK
jgi:hypothetical protein